MRAKILLTIAALIMTQSQAFAINYYQSTKDNKIQKIALKKFNDCDHIVYRVSGKDELPLEHQEKLFEALYTGKTINNLKKVITKLKSNPWYCTYGKDSEKLICSVKNSTNDTCSYADVSDQIHTIFSSPRFNPMSNKY